ncbi:hypothetical protein H5410_062610 [Solanum commersonii]|uniref:Disease resistance protein winged helix domain-containing protein n=1 Tax=Solanum commersonii TaxID=4109 RepID=A0A9J5WC14_SOLCO|nr:hypothetical protein H5410_062610 [Solanum commersonii]
MGLEVKVWRRDVLNDLVSRNLIQVAKRTYDGRISSCRIHDLLHSLCVDLAKKSHFYFGATIDESTSLTNSTPSPAFIIGHLRFSLHVR